jgi:isoleucyl-tRNA synthetase
VTLDQGSGVVHTAPGHGADDFRAGQKYGLEPYAPIDDSGRFTEGLDEYRGKTVFEANAPIVALLAARGALLSEAKLRHSYPHCWRCHNPVIFRATEQWFVSLEHADLRQRALEEIPKVKWTPGWGQERLHEMVATRPDWCISRQRFWGVPLIIFYCDACGRRLEDFAALRNVIGWFEKEGADAWFQHTAEELLPPGTKCSCGEAHWRKESDILDVWFDSGSSNLAVLSEKAHTWPADVYLEGPDQYRGWFQSSLLVALGVKNRAPYRQVVTHGWTLDADGRPMSKSLGNAMAPRDVYEKWGADLLRLWVAGQDYQTDQRMSEAIMNQIAEAYRKIRNTLRFALSNLYDFNPARDAVPDDKLQPLDAFALARTGELVCECLGWYEQFDFHRVFHALHDFCVVDLSAFYFDVLKDRLYTFAPGSPGRRSAQTAVYRVASALARLAAPILVFTMEEAWSYFPRAAGDSDSVHLTVFPKAEDFESALTKAQRAQWQRLLAVRGEVLLTLEKARNEKFVASALEAKIVLKATGALRRLLEERHADLAALFIVSQVSIETAADGVSGASEEGALQFVQVLRAEGAKCERCWNYSTKVGTFPAHPSLCERCEPVVVEWEREYESREKQAVS